ncbi:MAG: gliding motility-associated C-terminal domain-containing protein [Bacteroidota bacterium]
MNRIIRNLTTILIGIVIWTWLPGQMYAQCKHDAGDPVAGQFSINGTKVQVNGDGGNVATALNNIPIKICEGEIIKLKSTLPVTAMVGVDYWIVPYNSYNALATPPSNPISAAGRYTTAGGDIDIKMIAKDATNPDGFSAYATPGLYVITQYDNSTTSSGPGFHHACQVIEIIAPPTPVATVSVCSGSEIQVTIPVNANNIFDNYEVIFYPLGGPGNVTTLTGKQTLPYTVKEVMPDAQDRIIKIRGMSTTGGCNAPQADLLRHAVNSATLFKPNLISIAGTTTKAEYNLELVAQNGILWKFYRRDVTDPLNYGGYLTDVLSKSSTVTSGSEIVKLTVPDADKMYCFQVASVDVVCATKEMSNQEICTTPAKANALNNKNVISWARANGGAPAGVNPTPFINYEVDLMNADGTLDKTLFASTNITDLTFEHLSLVCGNDYIYRVRTNYGSLSYSQMIKIKAISDVVPSKIPKFFATMTNDNKNAYVQGQFNSTNTPTDIKPDFYKYYRANSLNGTYTLQNTGNFIFKDPSSEVDKQSYCYYMTWTNLCEKESVPSDKVCTVFLKASGATVGWTKETSLSAGTDSYIVKKVDPTTGNTIKDLATNLIGVYGYNTTPLPETEGQEIFIQIESRPIGWNTANPDRLPSTLSNIIRIFRPSLAMSPQIFTPNGDGQNDKFMVRGKFIKNLKMTIYDRWGNAIFYDEMNGYPIESSQDETTVIGWDGTMNNGNKALEGSYAYKIEVEDTVGQVTVKEGALLLAY